MKERNTMLGKYSKGTQRRIRVLLFITVIILFISVFYLSTGVSNIISSKKLLEDKKVELLQEEQRKSVLLEDIQKFDDPEYIRQYARAEYHYTGNGEIIFIFPSTDQSTGESTTNQEETKSNES